MAITMAMAKFNGNDNGNGKFNNNKNDNSKINNNGNGKIQWQ